MPAAQPPEAPKTHPSPPKVEINRMSDRWKAAMSKGSSAAAKASEPQDANPTPPTPPFPTPPKPPVPPIPTPPKPPEPPKPIAAEDSVVPMPTKPVVQAQEAPKEKPSIPHENFKNLENQRDEFRTKAEAAEKRASELEARIAEASKIVPPEYEQAKKERDHYKAFVEKFYVEHSPQFQEAFDNKVTEAISEAKELVPAEHMAKLEEVLKAPAGAWRDKQIEELGEGLNAFQQNALILSYTNIKRLQRQREAELAKAPENFKKLKEFEAEQMRAQEQQKAEAFETAYQAELKTFSEIMPEFQLIEGNSDHNVVAEKNRIMAKKFLAENLKPADHARRAFWAVKGLQSIETDALKSELIAKLQKQLQELQAANPSVNGTGDNKDGTEKPDIVSKWHEAMTKGVPQKVS